MEEKTIYTNSKGAELEIEKMPPIVIFYTVMKYGKQKLEADGYKQMIDRFDNIVKNANIVKIINDLGGEK